MTGLEVIHAITICFNYADYLQHTLANRKHFDRWTIITAPEDTETITIARAAQCELLLCDDFGDRGQFFDSAFAKAMLLNRALEQVDPSSWVLLVDADTLLPSRFRERLGALSLTSRSLYGAAGRRECENYKDFAVRRKVEPWDEFTTKGDSLLGYFHLFSNQQPNNRYAQWKRIPFKHDDLEFEALFKPGLVRKLPISCLHVGVAVENWGGRVSPVFGAESNGAPNPVGIAGVSAILQDLRNRTPWWLIGFDETTDWTQLSELAVPPIAVDWHGILSERAGLSGADNLFRAKCIREAWDSLGLRMEVLACEEDQLVAAMVREPPAVVLINVEPDVDCLLLWSGIVRKAGIRTRFCGRFFGYPWWPQSTSAITLTVGAPDSVHEDSSWLRECTPETCEREVTERVCYDWNCCYSILLRISSDDYALAVEATIREWPAAMRSNVTILNSASSSPAIKAMASRLGARYVDRPSSAGPNVSLPSSSDLLLALSRGDGVLVLDAELWPSLPESFVLPNELSEGLTFLNSKIGDCDSHEPVDLVAEVGSWGGPNLVRYIHSKDVPVELRCFAARNVTAFVDLWACLTAEAESLDSPNAAFAGLALALGMQAEQGASRLELHLVPPSQMFVSRSGLANEEQCLLEVPVYPGANVGLIAPEDGDNEVLEILLSSIRWRNVHTLFRLETEIAAPLFDALQQWCSQIEPCSGGVPQMGVLPDSLWRLTKGLPAQCKGRPLILASSNYVPKPGASLFAWIGDADAVAVITAKSRHGLTPVHCYFPAHILSGSAAGSERITRGQLIAVEEAGWTACPH